MYEAEKRQYKCFADMRVLLLEEDALLRGYHMALLGRLGITCESASDGADAVYALRQAGAKGWSHDICFVSKDVSRGEELVRMLRTMDETEHMLIICLAREEADFGGMKEAGADALLIHPINQAVLYHFLTGLQKASV